MSMWEKQVIVRKSHICLRCGCIIERGTSAFVIVSYIFRKFERDYICSRCLEDKK